MQNTGQRVYATIVPINVCKPYAKGEFYARRTMVFAET